MLRYKKKQNDFFLLSQFKILIISEEENSVR